MKQFNYILKEQQEEVGEKDIEKRHSQHPYIIIIIMQITLRIEFNSGTGHRLIWETNWICQVLNYREIKLIEWPPWFYYRIGRLDTVCIAMFKIMIVLYACVYHL